MLRFQSDIFLLQAIDRELVKRRQVIEMLTHAGKYYDSLLGEANIVATVRSQLY